MKIFPNQSLLNLTQINPKDKNYLQYFPQVIRSFRGQNLVSRLPTQLKTNLKVFAETKKLQKAHSASTIPEASREYQKYILQTQ